MSLASWKAEFYPVEANSVPGQEALDHSIRKWTGLLKKNLDRHEVTSGETSVGDDNDFLDIDGSSCALCAVYFDVNRRENRCERCPIVVTGNPNCNDEKSPYQQYLDTGAVVPMLSLLKRVKKATVTP